MQTIYSSEPGGIFPPTSPSDAQLHTGQLQDYQLMLSAMLEPPTTVNLANLIPIGPFSPMHRVSEDGLDALWHVLRDRAYIDHCTALQIKQGDLSVTLKDGQYVYEGWNNRGDRVTLALTANKKWQALKPRIERAAALLGGQINSSRRITLRRMCWFYGLAAWRPRHPQEHPAAVAALQEKIASHHLKLEDDFDILALRRRPTDKDRAAFRARRRDASKTSPIDTQTVHRAIIRAEIIDTLDAFLPANSTSPLTYLANDMLAGATLEQVRATPAVYLQKILQSNKAEQLGAILLSAMDWYGGEIGEETSPYINTRLIAQALQLWLMGPIDNNPEQIAGYALQARTNWGKSYQAIRAEFETHLQTSKRASSEKEAIVIARLLLSRFPSEFRVTDIPPDLPYRSSIVWVNFVTGVNLLKTADPRTLGRQSFQQLVNLPILLADGATVDILKYIGLARLLPTLDWAQTNGVLAQKPQEQYTQGDIELALSELEKQADALNAAIIQLNEAPPERLAIGKREMNKLFGEDAFISDGRKLARKVFGPVSFSRDIPYLEGKDYDHYDFLDVLASGKFDDQEKWFVTEADGTTVSERWIRIDQNRRIKTEGAWPITGHEFGDLQLVLSPFAKLADVKVLFENELKRYLEKTTTAYETLIKTLLASLPCLDRQALEFGEVRIYSLRKETSGVEAQNETPDLIQPLRARNGLILQATHEAVTTHYELLPRAGVIRRIEKLGQARFGGQLKTEQWRVSRNGTQRVDVLRHKELPFDWDAHSNGSTPKQHTCQAIIEQLGDTFAATAQTEHNAPRIPRTLSSDRSVGISQAIAAGLLFIDPKALRDASYGQTEFDHKTEWYKKALSIVKMLVPFWSSIEDLSSDDRTRWIEGGFGLFAELLSFAQPVGKFASGSMRLARNAGRVAIGASKLTLRSPLPSLTSLTMELLIAVVGELNPLDGAVSLLKASGRNTARLYRAGRFKFRELLGKAGSYDFVNSYPQIGDVGRWKPLSVGDELAHVKGIDDVPVRNLAPIGMSDYRLIDPLTSKPFGPRLPTKFGDLSPGRSSYETLARTDSHVIIELPDNTRVTEVFEVDGRTTLYIDDVPYRLDGDTLRRADTIDAGDTLKALPCRIRRVPGADVCETRYVTRTPGPTPRPGVFDETKSWAPWFGNSIYTPAPNRMPISRTSLAAHSTLDATMEFQTGIYGRVKVSVPAPEGDFLHTFNAGTVIIDAIDDSKHYLFIRLNAGNFYVAEVAKGQTLRDALIFRRASTLPDELREELRVVYTGSLNANNMVRIHGVDAVERAVKTMEEIAIPIGGHAKPPQTLKWLKVDTSPGEAAMFDHRTRMIISKLPEGATSWTRSKDAPESFRKRTADIFDTLFLEPVINLKQDSALKIDDTMHRLQKLIPRKQRPHNVRNIAYAEVITAAGKREVYVSVSGAQGATTHLPLFKKNRGTHPVIVGDTTYVNIDHNQSFPATALNVTEDGKLLAIPRTIDNIETYTPELTSRPTSLDSESKLISVIREKYPDRDLIKSVNIATTMPPCNSCSVVVKEFGYDGTENALQVLWK